MRDFNTFTDISKHRSMFTHNVAGTNRRKTDGARHAFAGITFTTVYRARFQIFVQRVGDRFPIASAVPDGASTLWRWCASIISISV